MIIILKLCLSKLNKNLNGFIFKIWRKVSHLIFLKKEEMNKRSPPPPHKKKKSIFDFVQKKSSLYFNAEFQFLCFKA